MVTSTEKEAEKERKEKSARYMKCYLWIYGAGRASSNSKIDDGRLGPAHTHTHTEYSSFTSQCDWYKTFIPAPQLTHTKPTTDHVDS